MSTKKKLFLPAILFCSIAIVNSAIAQSNGKESNAKRNMVQPNIDNELQKEDSKGTVPESSSQLVVARSTEAVSDQLGGNNQDTSVTRVAGTHGKGPSLERSFFPNFIQDQRQIWTSPLRLKRKDLFWLVPTGALMGEMLHRDAYLYRKLTPNVNPGNFSATFSDAGVVVLAGGVGSMYLLGKWKHNDHAQETGVLGVEAVADSLALSSALKYSLRRERPFAENGQGNFFASGGDSFPSNHAIVAWSVASVIAHEYPGPLTKIGVYGLASAVSIARVTGRQHFPADVVVGSALGWGIGHYVYSRHHNQELPGANIGTFSRTRDDNDDSFSGAGSVYVPLESWVYPAIDRLAALGFVRSDFVSLRPWTRMECRRLIQEADEMLSDGGPTNIQATQLLQSLQREFLPESERMSNRQKANLQIDSVYSKITGISGVPLNDGYHFGQTIYNDYGRPYREGFNSSTGFSGSAYHGHWAAYFRGEYQHSPSEPPLTSQAATAIANTDGIPLNFSHASSQVNRLRFLDAYASYTAKSWQFSLGKQSLWWGPGDTGGMLFSNNAEPITMFRIARVSPMQLPSILGLLGPLRTEFFIGQLEGYKYVRIRPTPTTQALFTGPFRQPLVDGGKVSFKPTPNLEFGVAVTTVFGGPGFPLNARAFFRSLGFSNTDPGFPGDPGDRRSSFDFKYRIPKLRNWLTLYNDSFSEDEILPLAYPRRSAMSPGIYISHFPAMPKLDFRAEAFYTDLPNLVPIGSYYFNNHYLGGYTNNGQLLGHSIGRDGTGYKLKSSFWFTPRNTVQLAYRNTKANPLFIGGGGLQDLSLRTAIKLGEQIDFDALVQYERWKFPVLATTRQQNIVSSIQITFHP